ncbi:MAG: preprotein translocase subunit SecE [Planctomycetia bacterium]|nr:preprotein translocase subunit SecE [Planctomycetia bacterium]
MGLDIYKKGQGFWARLSAYLLGGLLVVFGAFALYGAINVPNQYVLVESLPMFGVVTAYKVIALLVGLGGLLGLHLLLNKPSSVDLMIETEQEMRKVAWPTGKDVWNATLVVAFVSVALALVMWGLDVVLRQLFLLVFGRGR